MERSRQPRRIPFCGERGSGEAFIGRRTAPVGDWTYRPTRVVLPQMMKKRPLTLRAFLGVAFSERTWRRIVTTDSRASRHVRLFLEAARGPFSYRDLLVWPRRTVDRRLAQWRDAHVLESAERLRQRLPFDSRLRMRAKERIRWDRRGQRRGRPRERYRIIDPLARSQGLRPPAPTVAVAALRDPLTPRFLAAPLKLWAQLMATPEGRKFFDEYTVPLFPKDLQKPWHEVVEACEHANPSFMAALPDQLEAEVLTRCRTVLPQLADALERAAEPSTRPDNEPNPAPSSMPPEHKSEGGGDTPSE